MDSGAAPSANGRAITWRAILMGVAAGVLLSVIGYVNDAKLNNTMVVGNFLPVAVYGTVALFVLTVNLLLGRLRPGWAFSGGELAVTLCIMLAAASVATNGMYRTFTPSIAMPAQNVSQRPEFRKVTQYLPHGTILGDGDYNDPAVRDFIRGMRAGDEPIAFSDVPWGAWQGPALRWGGVMILATIVGLALAQVLHRQWARHELLAFPLATFADTLFHGRVDTLLESRREEQKSIFRMSMFWWMFALAFGVHMINGIEAIYPGQFVKIDLLFKINEIIAQKYPGLFPSWQVHWAFRPQIFFSVIAFAFFLSGEIAFTVGFGLYLYAFVSIFLFEAGYNFDAGKVAGDSMWGAVRFGAVIGFAVAIWYGGRRYYRDVLLRALGLGKASVKGVWAARVLLLGSALLVVQFCWVGFGVWVAIVLVLHILLIYTICARVVAETGMFFLTERFLLTSVFIGLAGPVATGPEAIALLAIYMACCHGDTRALITPMVVSGLEVCRREKIEPARVTPWMGGMAVLAIGVAFVSILYVTYDTGLPGGDVWARGRTMGFIDRAYRHVDRMDREGKLETAETLGPLQRLANFNVDGTYVTAVAVGLALTVMLAFLRLRWPRWPLHPVLLVLWGTYPVLCFGFSFMVGWLIRTAVSRLAGPRAVQTVKPAMVGLIAGELIAALVWIVVGWGRYLTIGFSFEDIYRIYPG